MCCLLHSDRIGTLYEAGNPDREVRLLHGLYQPTGEKEVNANEYQEAAARTLIAEPDHPFTGNELMLMWCALGLGGEAGEVLDILKKTICHQHGDVLSAESCIKVRDELGDLMWYVASIATLMDISLDAIMERNVAKLKQRYPDGYSSADSKARVDTNDVLMEDQ